MRALYRFGKHSRLKFVSHLDLQRFFQMAVRRTTLPIAYSQGFNPHPLISFASALAMGWTSDAEIVDIKFTENVKKAFAMEQLASALPPDLPLFDAKLVDDRFPAAMAMVKMADYRIITDTDLSSSIASFLDMSSYTAIRKTKSGEKPTDIRPWCVELSQEETDGGFLLNTRLMLTELETLKPDLLIRSLCEIQGITDCGMKIHRTDLLGISNDGKITSVMKM